MIEGTDFKVGSYFIYQDTASGSTDSFYVDEYKRYTAMQYGDGYYETISYNVKSSNSIYGSLLISAGGGKENAIACDWALTDRLYNIVFVYLPFVDGGHLDAGDRSYDYIMFHPTIKIAGIAHSNVYEMRSNTKNGQLTSLYSIQDGLIKFHTSTPSGEQTWNLIRSNVIR